MKDIVKFIIVLLIIVVIISILYSYSKEEGSTVISNDVTQNENIEINKENTNTTNKVNKEEQKDNKENKDQIDKKEDNIEEKEDTNKTENNEIENNQTQKEETTTSSNKGQAGNSVELTDREKAIKLVKDEYGVSDNSISYKIVNVDGANYTISVSSTETTQVIAWYTANIETGKVTME